MFHPLPFDKQPVILQVVPQLRAGGVERGTIEMAQAVMQAGWQALVASSGGPMTHSLKKLGAKHIELPLKSKNPLHIYQNAAALENIIKEYKVDIVHARSRAPAWSAYLACKRTHTRFITTFHGTYGLEGFGKAFYNSVMVKGNRVIAVSDFIGKHITDHYIFDHSLLRVIHRGVDVKKFSPEGVTGLRVAELIKSWHLPDEELPIILMPGRITRWKGQDILLKALAKLPHRNFFCIIMGDATGHPTYREELEAMIVNLNLCGYARIAPNTPFMAEAYMLAQVIVAPSIEPEAFGRIPVEAQAMGRPIIATNHGGFCETIKDDETGWLIPPHDSDALAERLTKALAMSADERIKWAEHARQHACDYFSTELMQHKTINLYSELLWPEDMQPYGSAHD